MKEIREVTPESASRQMSAAMEPVLIEALLNDMAACRTTLEQVGTFASLLLQAESFLAEDLKSVTGKPARTIGDLLTWGFRHAAKLEVVAALLSDSENHLQASVRGVRQLQRVLDRRLGYSREPGRPRELRGGALRFAEYLRSEGRSWQYVLREVNKLRAETGKGDLSLTTLRSAVNPRYRAKSSRSRFRMR